MRDFNTLLSMCIKLLHIVVVINLIVIELSHLTEYVTSFVSKWYCIISGILLLRSLVF